MKRPWHRRRARVLRDWICSLGGSNRSSGGWIDERNQSKCSGNVPRPLWPSLGVMRDRDSRFRVPRDEVRVVYEEGAEPHFRVVWDWNGPELSAKYGMESRCVIEGWLPHLRAKPLSRSELHSQIGHQRERRCEYGALTTLRMLTVVYGDDVPGSSDSTPTFPLLMGRVMAALVLTGWASSSQVNSSGCGTP